MQENFMSRNMFEKFPEDREDAPEKISKDGENNTGVQIIYSCV